MNIDKKELLTFVNDKIKEVNKILKEPETDKEPKQVYRDQLKALKELKKELS